MARVISQPEELDAPLLTRLLHAAGCLEHGVVTGVQRVEELSFSARIARLALTYSSDAPADAPPRLFVKLSRIDASQRVIGPRQRRAEVVFHTELVPAMERPPVARCFDAAWQEDTGACHLVFEDVSGTHEGGRAVEPPPRPQALAVAESLARLHAHWWDHADLARLNSPPEPEEGAAAEPHEWRHYPGFADGMGERLHDGDRAIYERVLPCLPTLWQRTRRGGNLTLIHGDLNFSNVLLPRDAERHEALVIDWQMWGVSFGAEDLAHLMPLYWDASVRRELEMPLLERYHEALLRHGVGGYDWRSCWHDYRLAVILRTLFMPMWFLAAGAAPDFCRARLDTAVQAFGDLHCDALLSPAG